MPTGSTAPYVTGIGLPAAVNVVTGDDYVTFSITTREASVSYIGLVLDKQVQIDGPYYPNPYSLFQPWADGGPVFLSSVKVGPGSGSYGMSFAVYSQAANTDGSTTYSVVLPLHMGTKAGLYTIAEIDLTGADGTTQVSGADLAAQGYVTSFSVTADQVAPALASLTLPDNLVASKNGYAALHVAASDAGSGIQSIDVHIAAVSGVADPGLGDIRFSGLPSYDYNALGTIHLVNGAGDAGMGGLNSEGSYVVAGVDIVDFAGNHISYTTSQLQTLGFDTQFSIGVAKPADFNGDGHSDLLWLNQNGAVSTWSAIGTGARDTIQQDTSDAAVDPRWKAVETFDWNGDGKADIVWRYPNGNMSIWNGAEHGFVQATYNNSTIAPEWKVAGAGDLNGDGFGDLVWRSDTTGAVKAWYSQGSGTFNENLFLTNSPGADWKIEGVGDFNGDGRSDILWRNDNGALSIWGSTGTSFATTFNSEQIDHGWRIEGIGDFNGDGKDDVVWVNGNGAVSAWLGTATGLQENTLNAGVPAGWQVAEVGDFNQDGLADLLWRYTDGTISIWHSTGNGWAQNTYADGSVGNDWTLIAHQFPA